ncbi:MAG TPA: hypothetical protein VF796_22115 [Humisphaera sp.]
MQGERIEAGTRCLAFNGQGYQPVVVTRANEDGTYNVSLGGDGGGVPGLDVMYGVGRTELVAGDERAWAALFPTLCRDGRMLTVDDFAVILGRLGKPVEMDKLGAFWGRRFNGAPADAAAAYKLILDFGYSATSLPDRMAGKAPSPTARLHKQYINNLRMGGRDPAEVARPVTFDDVRAALGLSAAVDAERVAMLDRAEAAAGVKLPPDVRALFESPGASPAFARHCTGPQLASPFEEGWKIHPTDRVDAVGGSHAVELLHENQGICTWLAVFDDGDAEARVYVTDRTGFEEEGDPGPDGPPVRWFLAAPTLSFFVWDLMQTSYAWSTVNEPENAGKFRRTDIGLAVDATR